VKAWGGGGEYDLAPRVRRKFNIYNSWDFFNSV
jgi:hypothetical protein